VLALGAAVFPMVDDAFPLTTVDMKFGALIDAMATRELQLTQST